MESINNSPLLYNLALTLIHFLWQGCVIALALKVLLSLTSQQNSITRYNIAILALLACLIAPIITYFSINQPVDELANGQALLFADIVNSTHLTSDKTLVWYQNIIDALPYLSLFWMSIVCLLACKLFIELYSVNQLPKQGTSQPDGDLEKRFNELTAKLNLVRTPKLLISVKTKVPMAIGWLKPIVLLPVSMVSGLSSAQLDMLILHELAHIRRNDYLVNVFQTIIETLLFFHPATQWISKQIRNEREYCSDDIAVAVSGTPIAYAHTLADTASLCTQHRHHTIPHMAMAASGGDLKQRVVRLVEHHHCSSNDDSGKFLASILIIVSILTVVLQPYISNSIIDLTSGRISFINNAKNIIQQQPENAVNLSATSIAKLLLTQDKAEPQKTAEVLTQTTQATLATPQEKVESISKPLALNSHIIESTLEKTAPVASQLVPKNEIAITESSTTTTQAPVEKKAVPLSKTEALLSLPAESSVTAAFERTNSLSNKSSDTNPYSAEITALTNEPMRENSPLLNREKISVDIKNEPRYFITREKVNQVIELTPQLQTAEILRSPDPRYPSIATRKGIEIDITVNFIIDVDGRVKDLTFEPKSKIGYFRSAIKSAMKKWHFLPAQLDGKPVESRMKKIFSFSLAQ